MSMNDQVNFVNGQLLLANYNTTVGHSIGFGSNGTMVNLGNDSALMSNESQKRDFVFDRTDVRVLFITLYSLVFCCCFFGKCASQLKLKKEKKNGKVAYKRAKNLPGITTT